MHSNLKGGGRPVGYRLVEDGVELAPLDGFGLIRRNVGVATNLTAPRDDVLHREPVLAKDLVDEDVAAVVGLRSHRHLERIALLSNVVE